MVLSTSRETILQNRSNQQCYTMHAASCFEHHYIQYLWYWRIILAYIGAYNRRQSTWRGYKSSAQSWSCDPLHLGLEILRAETDSEGEGGCWLLSELSLCTSRKSGASSLGWTVCTQCSPPPFQEQPESAPRSGQCSYIESEANSTAVFPITNVLFKVNNRFNRV